MVAAATDIFARRGYHETSMDDIAAAAGISKPMLYSYFGSKEGLFAACAREAGAALRRRLRSVVEAERAPDELFYEGLLAVFDFVEQNRGPWMVLYPEGGPAAGPIGAQASEARDAMVSLLDELFGQVALRQGVTGEALSHTRGLARAMTAATIGVASDWAANPEEPKELAVLRLMNFAWMGLGDLLEGRLWLPPAG
jgi:AcrR family transcriptional regulator